YDALVEVWNGVPWFSPVWCRAPRVTMLHHVHGPMWGQILPGPLASFGRVLEARIAPPFYRSTETVTPSSATRDELLGLGFRPELVTAVDNGIDPFFSPGGAQADLPTIVAVGRLAPVKRFGLVLDAMERVHARVPEARLVIVGEGPLRPELEDRVRSAGAQGWITFLGHVDRDELREQYRRAWVVTSASLAEGWGLTMTEASACGAPAVATDISGHRCSVVDGVTGVLTEPAGLGDALADLLLDHERRERMRAAGLARAATLTWESSARGLLDVLARVVRQRSDRGRS
ncbi:MAG: glycosyltransferase family 4 protein, partial [Acidimicrobiia bacterium]